jgi:glyoxylase-like metal-dependent hydrolase (beta-lactamase superfamily II)
VSPLVQTFFDPATFTATHLVSDPATKSAAIIDAVLDFDPKSGKLSTGSVDAVLAAIAEQGLDLLYCLETHAHADHLSAGDYVRGKTKAKLAIGAKITDVQSFFVSVFDADDVAPDGSQFDLLLDEADVLPLGALSIRTLHTPGHTSACVTYIIGDAAFVGDTMFMPDYGTARTDFPGGDAATLYRSIKKILSLPPETRIYVGHDYLPASRTHYRWETSVREQTELNIHLSGGLDEQDFVELRQARDRTLAAPALLLPSLQVNIRGGKLPPAAPSGKVFLRIPVTAV